jgi:hypothetical protein
VNFFLLRRLLGVKVDGQGKLAKVLLCFACCICCSYTSKQGTKTGQRRSINVEYWLDKYGRKSTCGEGRFGKTFVDESCLYSSGKCSCCVVYSLILFVCLFVFRVRRLRFREE